ncbi:MAG: hypothetical protein AAFX81_20095 [Pseudomonadota bacterium]
MNTVPETAADTVRARFPWAWWAAATGVALVLVLALGWAWATRVPQIVEQQLPPAPPAPLTPAVVAEAAELAARAAALEESLTALLASLERPVCEAPSTLDTTSHRTLLAREADAIATWRTLLDTPPQVVPTPDRTEWHEPLPEVPRTAMARPRTSGAAES